MKADANCGHKTPSRDSGPQSKRPAASAGWGLVWQSPQGPRNAPGGGWATHVTEPVPRTAPPGAGGFSDAVAVTVVVAPSGHGDLHLGNGERRAQQTPCRVGPGHSQARPPPRSATRSLWAEAWGGGARGTAKHLQPTTAHSYPEWERDASESKGRALSSINCYQLCLSFPPAGPVDGCKESRMASGPMGRPALFHSTRAGHGASRQAGGNSPPLPACTSLPGLFSPHHNPRWAVRAARSAEPLPALCPRAITQPLCASVLSSAERSK